MGIRTTCDTKNTVTSKTSIGPTARRHLISPCQTAVSFNRPGIQKRDDSDQHKRTNTKTQGIALRLCVGAHSTERTQCATATFWPRG
jgi:hypothetical protein